MKKIYLDYNATTPLDPRVLEAMMPYFKDSFGNPSSIHSFGGKGRAALDAAREEVAGLIGGSAREIVFTSGGSESNNLAIKGAAYSSRKKGNHFVTTSVEHDSALEAFKFLEKQGFRVTYLGVDRYGLIDLDELRDAISGDTVLVSCIFANNETGAVMPAEEIAGIAKEQGALFHTDAVQAAGKIDIDLKLIPADLVSISAHKFYGPKGAGALFVRDGISGRLGLTPLIHGGGQERGIRSGTENVPAIAGLGMAASLARREQHGDRDRVKPLRDAFLLTITSSLTDVGINSPEDALWNTLSLSFAGVNGGSLSMALDLEGVAVSTGSACSEGNIDPSHVLKAMGLSREKSSSSVRLSLGRFTTADDVEDAAEKIIRTVLRIRGVKG